MLACGSGEVFLADVDVDGGDGGRSGGSQSLFAAIAEAIQFFRTLGELNLRGGPRGPDSENG